MFDVYDRPTKAFPSEPAIDKKVNTYKPVQSLRQTGIDFYIIIKGFPNYRSRSKIGSFLFFMDNPQNLKIVLFCVM